MLKLNLGCGPVQPQGWVNVDGSRRACFASRLSFFDRLMVWLKYWPPTEFNHQTYYANLLKRLPWQDGSAEVVYMGEVLEHFTRDDGFRLLRECYRILEDNGVIRIRVPDNARFWRNYLTEYEDVLSKPRQEWNDQHSRWVEMFFRDICVRSLRGGSLGHYHKWMYDEVSLTKTLEAIGFTDVRRRGFLESSIQDVDQVETRDDLTVEARKPESRGNP
jgi:predicted SAM-dependent methyltransferase